MKKHHPKLRLATSLILAAAFPLASLAAQETQSQTPTAEPIEITPPPAPAAPSEAPAVSPPAASDAPVSVPAPAAPATETIAEAEEGPATRVRATSRSTAAVRQRSATPPRAEAPPSEASEVPAAPLTTPAADVAPSAQAVAEASSAAEPAPPLANQPADLAPPAENDEGSGTSPLLLLVILAAGMAAALFLLGRRRRRRFSEEPYDDHRTYDAPGAAAEPEPHFAAPAVMTAAAAPGGPLLGDAGRPWIDLLLRPVRAGVGENDARVEFELCVDNKGSAPAEDVRISTFMLASGSPEASEAERVLLEPRSEAVLPAPIDAGETKRIASAVALPRDELQDSILPLVVANASYRLPDGSEGRTSVSFAVGVPWDGDLAHFDVDNPSGLHEGVEARQQGKPHRV